MSLGRKLLRLLSPKHEKERDKLRSELDTLILTADDMKKFADTLHDCPCIEAAQRFVRMKVKQ